MKAKLTKILFAMVVAIAAVCAKVKNAIKRLFTKPCRKYTIGVLIVLMLGASVGGYYAFRHKSSKPRIHLVSKENPVQFKDGQPVQLKAATKNGVAPMKTLDDVKKNKKLVQINTCANYKIDHLTHSVPYLVPKAANLVNTIGQNFRNRLKKDGYCDYRIILTSVTRSIGSVKKLQKGNKNATTNSCHCYGTTFDITYARFDSRGGIGRSASRKQLEKELILTLHDLRQSGKCLVVYETKQHCFHITVRN